MKETAINKKEICINPERTKKIWKFFTSVFIFPVVMLIVTSILTNSITDGMTLFFLLVIVSLALYLFKQLLFKEINVKTMLFMLVFLLLKSFLVAFSIIALLMTTIAGGTSMYSYDPELNAIIIYLDVVNAYIVIYIVVACISFFMSDKLAQLFNISWFRPERNIGGVKVK